MRVEGCAEGKKVVCNRQELIVGAGSSRERERVSSFVSRALQVRDHAVARDC
jgi:hypothetical protein